ncbi:enoyl-CoA hydratase/isomerase family protein [Vibrio marisflavi]|uniref:3-hydroxyisobutyryl-CoA hydrolase n=1 Tax=Vibrio marisflavi CECT 7928 TaxID=634439 RepID=A0ABM9A5V4_9VIBR|nr:enoyl-CoA hydratase/isomerase family protein [Vibrio marisflavi]CAH0540290.1 Carnitinyl-CoA dehydratase [Vibrio marisflavi CECT 7928]
MTDSVKFEELICTNSDCRIGVVTLDNPSSLNALTYNMLQLLKNQLERWQVDHSIVCVFLQGGGEKAFCAGGDVRTMYHVMSNENNADIEKFCTSYFTLEYQCDYLIHTFRKPIIAWGNGIVMGGGMGLFMGASHRVVTENSRLAMPEVTIGLYPDVGGTWFLSRLEPGIGLFLGLTGASVNANDAITIKMADHFALSKQKLMLLDQLMQLDWLASLDHRESITMLLDSISRKISGDMPQGHLMPYFSQIQRACSESELGAVVEKIHAIEVGSDDKWLSKAKGALQAGSPITAHICFRQVTQYQSLSLEECFRLELSLSVRSSTLGEFKEGVRARLIDKDGQPNWKFDSIMAVDSSLIDQLFMSLWPVDRHPLAQLGLVTAN